MESSDVSRVNSDLLEALAETGRAGRYSTGSPRLVAKLLGEIPIFSELSGHHRRRVAAHGEIAEIPAGQAFVWEGFTGEAAFVLLTGSAIVDRGGVQVNQVDRGAVIGELSLLCGHPCSATVTAAEDLWVLRIKRTAFRRLLEQEPTLALHLLESVGQRLWAAEHAGP